MHSGLKQICQSYISIPIIAACMEQGMFALLGDGNPRSKEWLINKLDANEDFFVLALQALEGWGCVREIEENSYILISESADYFSGLDLPLFCNSSSQDLLDNTFLHDKLIVKLLELYDRPPREADCTSVLFENSITFPFLRLLEERSFAELLSDTSEASPNLQLVLKSVFLRKNWVQNYGEEWVTSEEGAEVLEDKGWLSFIKSHRVTLSEVSDLLFNSEFTTRESESFEAPVSTSAFSVNYRNDPYFQNIESLVVKSLNYVPVERQPKGIVLYECDDDLYKEYIANLILNCSERGKYLENYPIVLISVNSNGPNALETNYVSGVIEHYSIRNNIYAPVQISGELQKMGFSEFRNCLHILEFPNRKFPRQFFENIDRFPVLENVNSRIDVTESIFGSNRVLSIWKSHFDCWSEALGSGSLIVLGAHSCPVLDLLDRKTVSEKFFSAIQQLFSFEFLISAREFIELAASVGLFGKNPSEGYLDTRDNFRLTLNQLEKRDFEIRNASDDDLNDLYELENLCWEYSLKTPDNIIARRIEKSPKDQFVLVKNNRVMAVIFSQRIASADQLYSESASDVHLLNSNDGRVLQLLAVNVHPECQNLMLGDQLLEFMLQRCTIMQDIDSVVGVTLCKDYGEDNSLPLQDYIHLRDESGRIKDPILSFHESHGATIESLIAGYRPSDLSNQGCGVLVRYDLRHRKSNLVRDGEPTMDAVLESSARSNYDGDEISLFVGDTIRNALGDNSLSFELQSPLMEMGLNSASLLKLQLLISEKYGIALGSTFFFEFDTAAKVVTYLTDSLCSSLLDMPGKSDTGSLLADETRINRPSLPYSPIARNEIHSSRQSLESNKDDIAIVGMSCKLPGGIETPEGLWNAIINEDDLVGVLPENRFVWPKDIDPENTYKGIDRGGFIEDVTAFDADFFRISPRDAKSMDPQQRILLELAWSCLENAGITPSSMRDSATGVFVGASGSDYARLLQESGAGIEAPHGVGQSMSVLANRISYFFDFSGPSIQIDTACSSSLTAIHVAVQALRNKECSKAIVGGINLICHPFNSIAYYKAGMLSIDGRCKPFDAAANGYVRSEGAVMFLLEPLENAQENCDSIFGVIKGSSINHAGLTSGLTAPNPRKQSQLLQSAWENANIDPRDISYIETHGTGTPLGDPIEVLGIQQAFSNSMKEIEFPSNSCGIGSIKSNLGHLEAASGIVGLLKVILCMLHKEIPRTINYREASPIITYTGSPLYVTSERQVWESTGHRPRCAGISNFGSGGANAHVVIEEYIGPSEQKSVISGHRANPSIVIFSAKTEIALVEQVQRFYNWIELQDWDSISFEDISYTLQMGREPMEERVGFLATSIEFLYGQLSDFLNNFEDPSDSSAWFKGSLKSTSKDLMTMFEDDEIQEIIGKWTKQGRYTDLIKLWVNGSEICWNSLYIDGHKPKRICLPTYPFSRDSHWVNACLNNFSPDTLTKVGARQEVPSLFSKEKKRKIHEISQSLSNKKISVNDAISLTVKICE